MTAIIYDWLKILLNCFVDLEGLGSLLQTSCFSHFIYLCLFFNCLCITAMLHCFCLSVKAFLKFSFFFFFMAKKTHNKVPHLLCVHEEIRGSNCLPPSFKWKSNWKAQVDKGLIRALGCPGLRAMLCNIQNSPCCCTWASEHQPLSQLLFLFHSCWYLPVNCLWILFSFFQLYTKSLFPMSTPGFQCLVREFQFFLVNFLAFPLTSFNWGSHIHHSVSAIFSCFIFFTFLENHP